MKNKIKLAAVPDPKPVPAAAVFAALGLPEDFREYAVEPRDTDEAARQSLGYRLAQFAAPFENKECLISEALKQIARELDIFARAVVYGQSATLITDHDLEMQLGTLRERLLVLADLSEAIQRETARIVRGDAK